MKIWLSSCLCITTATVISHMYFWLYWYLEMRNSCHLPDVWNSQHNLRYTAGFQTNLSESSQRAEFVLLYGFSKDALVLLMFYFRTEFQDERLPALPGFITEPLNVIWNSAQTPTCHLQPFVHPQTSCLLTFHWRATNLHFIAQTNSLNTHTLICHKLQSFFFLWGRISNKSWNIGSLSIFSDVCWTDVLRYVWAASAGTTALFPREKCLSEYFCSHKFFF